MKRNKFSKALKQLKSTELDEKIKRLEEAAPTNSIGGVYALNQPGQRLGPYDPPKVFYPDIDGNWPDGIPGTPGEKSYTRPAGHWDYGPGASPSVDWDNIVDFSHSGTSTDGFIDATDGTVLVNLPPDSSDFILGPLVDGYVYNHGYDDFTNIGYIQKDTRQFILLGRISGYWRNGSAGNPGAGRNPSRQWGGTEDGFTSYNENFTLAMAQWFRDQYNAGTYVKNMSYFYAGGQPQRDNPDPNAPPGSKGGAMPGAGGGGGPDEEGPFGSGGDPNIGGHQNPPEGGGPKDAGFPWFPYGKKKPKRCQGGRPCGDTTERDGEDKDDDKEYYGPGGDPRGPQKDPNKKPQKDPNKDGEYYGPGGDPRGSGKGQEPQRDPNKNGSDKPQRGQGGRPLGDTTQRGGKKGGGSGSGGSSGGGSGSGGGGSAGSGTGTGSGTRPVTKPKNNKGFKIDTKYHGTNKDASKKIKQDGFKPTKSGLLPNRVWVGDQNVARNYSKGGKSSGSMGKNAPENQEIIRVRTPRGSGMSFPGPFGKETALPKDIADRGAGNKNVQKRSGSRPKAGTTTRAPGMPTGGGGGGLVRPIEPWIGKRDPLQGYTYNYKKGRYELANSNIPQGEVLSESKKRILREIKQPYKLPEQPKQKYKMNFKGKFSPQNTPDVTACKQTDEEVKAKNAAGQTWRTKDKHWSRYESQERMNIIYDQVGHGDMYWDMIVNENQNKKVVRDRKIQEQLNIIAHEKAMLQEDPNYVSPFKEDIKEQETLQADKDPLFKKVAGRLKKEIDYPDKPSKAGYPDTPPPEMDNGFHPEYGNKGNYYNKLDPQSAEAMPPTGNAEIDAKVQKAKRIKKVLGKKG